MEKLKEFLEKSFQVKENWALLLNNLINEIPNDEISKERREELKTVIKKYCEIRAILFSKIILEEDKKKFIQNHTEKYPPRFFKLFEILKRFPVIYEKYSRRWMEQSLIFEGKLTIRHLSQKLKAIKEEAVQEILNGNNSMLHKFKDIPKIFNYFELQDSCIKISDQTITPTKNLIEEISELIGILLGDGHIEYNTTEHRYYFTISLNGVDEAEYLKYVKNLIIDIYQKKPIENWERDKPSTENSAKGASLTLYGKEIINELLDLGLKSGNKTTNQVEVPSCVFSSNEFIIKCLKGLFDTDGSLFLNKSRRSIYLSFSNASMNLVNGFIDLCKEIGIIAHFYGAYERMNKKLGTISKEYLAHISQKKMVKKFLNIINPEKWKNNNRREFMGTLLILLKNPEYYNYLIREYNLMFPNKQFRYSLKSLRFLKDFCNNIKLQVNNSLIESAINESFEFKYLNYSIEFAEYLKVLSIKNGSVRKVVKDINKKYRITAKNYIKKLFAEPEYSNLYGNQGYFRWINHNFEVLIDVIYNTNSNKKIIRVRRFSFDIKKKICILIFNILQSSNNQKSDSNIKEELSYLIHNLDLNYRLIKEENLLIPNERIVFKPKVLLFERLSFLLNNSEHTSVINDHFSILIIFVKEILRLINVKKKIELETLRKHLRNNLEINWRSNNIKKILISLNIYKELIFEM